MASGENRQINEKSDTESVRHCADVSRVWRPSNQVCRGFFCESPSQRTGHPTSTLGRAAGLSRW